VTTGKVRADGQKGQPAQGFHDSGSRLRVVGHWRRVRTTILVLLVLLLVQWPMRHAVSTGDVGWLTREGAGLASGIPRCLVPGRLALLVGTVAIYVYVLAAWRARNFVTVRAPESRTVARWSLLGAVLVTMAGVADLVENVVAWPRFGELSARDSLVLQRAAATEAVCPSLDVVPFSYVLSGLGLAGSLVLVGTVVGAMRVARRSANVAATKPPLDVQRHDANGQIICCSGGGIRSAAFSLGALQALMERGEYQKSSSVIGVSGGGYIAAAFHMLRRSLLSLPSAGGKEADAKAALPYSLGSPELARLRRHTDYLLPSVAVGARGVMSLFYGAIVNLVLIGVALRVTAWILGWLIAEVDMVRGLGTRNAVVAVGELPVWYWVAALGPLGLMVLLFLAEVVVDRFRVPPKWLRTEGRALAQSLFFGGLATAGLLLGVPYVLVAANNFGQSRLDMAATSDTGPGDMLTSGAATAVANMVGTGASGADVALDSQFGLGTLATLGVAFLALARSAWKGLEALGGVGARSKKRQTTDWRARLLRWVRTKLVPWLGSALLVLAGLIVLLRWTAGYVASEEWRARWWVAAVCAGLVLLITVCTDATRTSLHPYYRERLSRAYLVRRTGPDAAEEYDYALPLPVSTWATATDGGPQLVIVASANAFDPEFIPSDRGCAPFVFDPQLTGVAGDVTLPDGGLVPTAAYEVRADYHQRDVTVAGAVAISGAAFAPLTGRENARTRPLRLLFAVVNARLGVWLPNPYWGTAAKAAELADTWAERAARGHAGLGVRVVARLAEIWAHLVSTVDKPGPYRLVKEAFGRTSLYDRRLYVTDGGHYDNLGLLEALRRRPRRIIVIDASADAVGSFSTLGSAIATARMDLGVEVELDPRPLRPSREAASGDEGDRVQRAWARGVARHPDGGETEILYVKAMLAGKLSWDIEAYALAHREFPLRTTGDQIYGEFDFEAYRALGHALTSDMLDSLRQESPAVETVQASSPNR